MANEEKNLLTHFEGRIRHLIYLYEKQKEKMKLLQNTMEQQEKHIAQLTEEKAMLTRQNEQLIAAKLLHATTKEDVKHTKALIATLVREVDQCINLLKS